MLTLTVDDTCESKDFLFDEDLGDVRMPAIKTSTVPIAVTVVHWLVADHTRCTFVWAKLCAGDRWVREHQSPGY